MRRVVTSQPLLPVALRHVEVAGRRPRWRAAHGANAASHGRMRCCMCAPACVTTPGVTPVASVPEPYILRHTLQWWRLIWGLDRGLFIVSKGRSESLWRSRAGQKVKTTDADAAQGAQCPRTAVQVHPACTGEARCAPCTVCLHLQGQEGRGQTLTHRARGECGAGAAWSSACRGAW